MFDSDDSILRATHPITTETVTFNARQWRILAGLDRPCRASRLAARLGIDLADLAELVQPLVEAGAVVVENRHLALSSIARPADSAPPGMLSFPRREGSPRPVPPLESTPPVAGEPERGFLTVLGRGAARLRHVHPHEAHLDVPSSPDGATPA